MFAQKLKVVALVLAVAVLFASGAGLFARRPASQDEKKEKQPGAAKNDKKKGEEAKKQTPVAEGQLRQALAKTIEFKGIDDKGVTLQQALEMLEQLYKVQFDINERAFKAEGLNDVPQTEVALAPLRPMKTSLRSVLEKILSRVPVPSGATFLLRKDRIEITTAEFVRVELGLRLPDELNPLDDSGVTVPILDKLPRLVQEEFRKLPVSKALDQLGESAGLNVVIDARAEKKAELEVTAKLTNVPADTAIRLLADMAGLEVVRVNNVLYVTTPENAARLEKSKQRWERAPLMPFPMGFGGLGGPGVGGLGVGGLGGGGGASGGSSGGKSSSGKAGGM